MPRISGGPNFTLFFVNATATTEIYTLSLHDALPISTRRITQSGGRLALSTNSPSVSAGARSEEHTSELQSRLHLVCRLLLEKKYCGPDKRAAREVNEVSSRASIGPRTP